MAKVVVLGAGISGHTASALLKKKLGKKHEVVVITPNAYYHWIPSNIWIGVGRMTIDQVRFRLAQLAKSLITLRLAQLWLALAQFTLPQMAKSALAQLHQPQP